MEFSLDISGMEALDRKVTRAISHFGGKPVEDIMIRGARVIRKEARKRAPKGKSFDRSHTESRALGLIKETVTTAHKAGMLRSAIVARKLRKRPDEMSKPAYAGRPFGMKGIRKAPHYHLVHDGTVERFHKSGKSVGRMTANPFFADAVRATASQVFRQIEGELDALFEKNLKGEGVI